MVISEILTRLIIKFRSNKLLLFVCYPVLISLKVLLRIVNIKNKYYNYLFSNVTDGSLVVKIKDIPGIFEIDARSHILQKILIDKNYESVIVSMIRKNLNTDKDAINIGANIGIYTVLLANLINKDCKVLAIEPTPMAFKYLTNNLKRNKLDSKVVLYNGICIDKKGEYDLNIIEGKEEYSCIGESFHQSKIKEKIIRIKVEGDTINNLVTTCKLNPGIIVMDVEGAEMKVLAGASAVLEQYKPIIISELVDNLLNNQETSSKEVIDFLIKSGYIVYDTAGNKVKYPFHGNIIAKPA
jgi:FkbM family methyltransferase